MRTLLAYALATQTALAIPLLIAAIYFDGRDFFADQDAREERMRRDG